METLTQIVKGTAQLDCIRTGGIAEYIITSCNGKKYLVEIDLSDKVDCGESASFKPYYEKAIILMRWIRRAMEKGDLIDLNQNIV
jgi:hypothetical protein